MKSVKGIDNLAYCLHRFWRLRLHVPFSEGRRKHLQMLRPGSPVKELEVWDDCRRFQAGLWTVLFTIVLVAIAAFAGQGTKVLTGTGELKRLEPGGGSRKTEITVQGGGNRKTIEIEIPEREYRKEELAAKLAEGREYIKKHYLGENPSAEKITKPLRLVSTIQDSAVKVRWKLDAAGYVNKDGTLNTDDLKEETEVTLTAEMVYCDVKEPMMFNLLLCPPNKSREQRFWESWEKQWQMEKENSSQEKRVSLPGRIGNQTMHYSEVNHPLWRRILLMGILFSLILPFLFDYQLEQGIRKRELQLQQEYPEMIECFILLLGAGLTIRGAWQRITKDYEARRECGEISGHYLYEEMILTRMEMENGKNEAAAYQAFGRRISMLSYMKFSTLLVQNLRKGSDDLLRRMEVEAEDALRARREFARQLGEEAGTKLLLPMIMMLVVVFALIMAAAFQSM